MFKENIDIEAQSYNQKMGKHLSIQIRHGFITKVFGIVGLQLGLSTILGFLFSSMIKESKLDGSFILIAAILNIVLLLTMACYPTLLRTYPTNYALLGLFTLTKSVLLGALCSQYSSELILTAAGLTAFIVLSLSAFAVQTRWDFTGMGGYLFAASLGLMAFVFLSLFFKQTNFTMLLITGAILILFCLYLVYDMQLIVGGDHRKFEFSVDDYAFAALVLYIDIVQIFQLVLQLLAQFRDE